MGTDTIGKLTCLRCGYEWYPLRPTPPPKVCPNCNNRKWNTPKES